MCPSECGLQGVLICLKESYLRLWYVESADLCPLFDFTECGLQVCASVLREI